jgi:hypothetical protein
MMGSVISQGAVGLAAVQVVSEQMQVLSAIKTPEAPMCWALRTFCTKVQCPRSIMSKKGDG